MKTIVIVTAFAGMCMASLTAPAPRFPPSGARR
jgi:hypothetical protein